MLRIILILLIASVLAYLGLCAALFLFQRSLIYFPQPSSPNSSATTITLPTTEASVRVTVKPHEGPNAIVYFGGNAENVTDSLPTLSTAFPDHAIYLMNYRGYGESTGKPSEKALIEDALALFDIVHTKHQHITIMGRSLVLLC